MNKKWFKKIHQYICNLSLKYKIIAITSSAIIIVGMTSIFAMNGVMKNNKTLLYNSIASSLMYSADKIETILESVENMSTMIIADSNIQNNLIIKNDKKKSLDYNIASRNLYNSLLSYYFNFNNKYLDYMCIYSNDIPVCTNSAYQILPNSDGYAEIKAAAEESEGAIRWMSSYGDKKGLLLVRSIRKIKNLDLSTLGFVAIKVDIPQMIHDSTNFGDQFPHSSFILLSDQNVLYRSPSISEEQAKTLINLKANYDVIPFNSHYYFAVKDSIPKYNLDYICLVSYDSIQQYITRTSFIYVIIIIASILLCISLSSSLVQNITKHFDVLVKKMNVFQNNNMEILSIPYNYSKRHDELGIIHTRFDNMANEIKTLVQKNYINEILRKDAQLKALESQIDPHFLYNTLESVNWRARAIGATKISLMVESLGNLLRSTLSQAVEDFSLKKELELVQYYMTIQQIRYEDRLNYELKVDDNILDASIPKLSIQPLVENAIKYALEEITEECYISIAIALNDKNLEIRVKNNGSQFEENLLNKLKAKEIFPNGLGIGLINIDNRIKLTFGNDYGLTFYNEDDFAIAMITIPYIPIK